MIPTVSGEEVRASPEAPPYGEVSNTESADEMGTLDSASPLPPSNAICLVLGGAGFIGSHLAARLMRAGRDVIVVDKKPCAFFSESEICHQFLSSDLRHERECERVFSVASTSGRPLWVFLFAADMGGMGYIASNESAILLNNTSITVNVVRECMKSRSERLFVASSACVYPEEHQAENKAIELVESSAWPANPQDGYGLEKLYGEEVALSAGRASDGKLKVRIARFHNVYGEHGCWIGGREKAPAAFLRKALLLQRLDQLAGGVESKKFIEIWGDGLQQRTFCHVSDAVEGVLSLICSNLEDPVNIGSNEVVSVKDLAILAGEAVGINLNERLQLQPKGPIGVRGRSADISLAARELDWKPRVHLREGLTRTGKWLNRQLADMERVTPSSSWREFLDSGLVSGFEATGESYRMGLLVPMTSRSIGRGVEKGLRTFLRSIKTTVWGEAASKSPTEHWEFELLFGVDKGDVVLDPQEPGSLDLSAIVKEEMPLQCADSRIMARTITFNYAPGSVCRIWNDLAVQAFVAGADFTVLLGDDVELLSSDWNRTILQEFKNVSLKRNLPFGFACVAFADGGFPGFPTFPVIHRTHYEIFGDKLFHSSFVNQDVDPFLFQLYRGFNAALIAPDARLRNGIGGEGEARYEKVHANWTGSLLTEARAAAAKWLANRRELAGPLLKDRGGKDNAAQAAVRYEECITLDVVVPTFRVWKKNLELILGLKVPPNTSTQFTIVCDNPESRRIMKELEERYKDNAMVRIRSNNANIGAGESRNRGLGESAADWIVFLDDDVVPRPDILEKYVAAIRAHPHASGFIGLSILPAPQTPRQLGIFYAGVSFFWSIASWKPTCTEIPWGVTANICVKRIAGENYNGFDRVYFSYEFPKTGGGEDVDFCLRQRALKRAADPKSEGFVAVPDAVIEHPYWDNGIPNYSHFYGWSFGDGHLIDIYPHMTYRILPNLMETLTLLLAAFLLLLVFLLVIHFQLLPSHYFGYGFATLITRAILVLPFIMLACILADFSYDVYKAFFEYQIEQSKGLSILTRLLGLFHGLIIRTYSELGRMHGHLSRGKLLRNLCTQFNWFGDMWAGAIATERREAAKRTAMRLLFISVTLSFAIECFA